MLPRTLKRSTYLLLSLFLGLVAYKFQAATHNTTSRLSTPLRRPFSSSSSTQSIQHDIPSHYQASVAFQPKSRDENRLMRKHLKMKPLDSPTGEDNYFVANRSGNLACGVADGVGGWSEMGFDSSAISRELCKAMSEEFEKGKDESLSYDPKYLLDFAFKKIQKDGIVKVGGTTACLGVFSPDYKLKVANLGDSWCGIFRQNKLIAETKIQTHGFNTPYQLAMIPREIHEKNPGSRFIMDQPSDADVYEFAVEKDDIVMFATDGVIDNIDVKDIELYLSDNENKGLDEVSKTFVNNVAALSKDENFPSVFSQELTKITGQFYSGGKEDDITVVMVKVQ
ncbi:Protein phosphatase 2C 7, mitochondrial [Cyberlindnera fabianii]|uniref:Protein phosphatase n=1 Tax=Cyberlindnera fabianii TaxID=36022 RepID=A0A1V2L129_CYBFA|nr:Protein phosphatase 2C 7, mitochondrial [Cyberlindnera fabianii]